MDLILVSFIIAIFGVNSKINVLCENVSAFVYQAKKFLNLQVEIILGIISIIILSSLIVLNYHVWFFFQYNLIYFDFVRTSNSPKSCVWYHCIKLLFKRVWWELCLILFPVILSTPGIHIYCNYLLTTKVTAFQVVRTSFQHSFISGLPRQSLLLFLTSHGIDPEYMSMIMCNLRGLNFLLCALEK